MKMTGQGNDIVMENEEWFHFWGFVPKHLIIIDDANHWALLSQRYLA